MIVTAALTVVLAHLLLGVVLWLRVRKLYSYPGLLGFPVIGNLYYFYRTLFLGSFESMRVYFHQTAKKHGKNGVCFHYIYGYRKLVLISNPQIIKEIGFHPHLKDKPCYPFRGFRRYMNGPFSRPRSDQLWRMRRTEYNYLLKKATVENRFFQVFLNSANKLVEILFALPSPLNIHSATIGVANSSTMETLFGVESSIAFHPEVISNMKSFKEVASVVIANPRIANTILNIVRPFDEIYISKIGTMRKLVLREIYKSMNNNQSIPTEKASTESYHPLSMYIASRIEKSKKFNNRVVTELQEVFITSSHSVASMMSSTLTFLAVIPELQERAWKEQYDIFGKDTREPTLEDLEQMKLLERCLLESLRFLSPAFIAKQAAEDIEVDGITIPKGAMVVYLVEITRKDPNYFKDPEAYDPDRFLQEDEELKYYYKPFGIGVRSCPGMHYAMTQLKITLSKVLRRIKVSPVNKDLRFEDFEFEAQILLELKNPPLLQVEERV
ncbi:cytochrome P450 4c21 [Halyomorpha halys]|uniref:cytochrome P450 4c21 n=1 Tax=Halyomorpha halys TaxID=286706 RepID=UPI0034D36FC1